MIPLTPEQVKGLRLPEGFSLVKSVLADGMWLTAWARNVDRTRACIAHAACGVANGDLPPESLDDVWRRAEGTKTDLDVVLEYRAVEIHKGRDGSNCWITLFPCNGEPCKTFDGVVLSEVLAAARKWIEEKKP